MLHANGGSLTSSPVVTSCHAHDYYQVTLRTAGSSMKNVGISTLFQKIRRRSDPMADATDGCLR
jgi:hypothetical protein